MSDSGMAGNLSAKFGFLPRGNQQLIILAGLTALIGALGMIVFAYVGKPVTVPACITVGAALLAVGGWLLCRRSTELEGSPPVTFTDARTGRSVTADPRLLANPEKVRLLSDAFKAMLDRRPLPIPDGMVRADGTPDVSRMAEAEAIVNNINQQMQQNTSGVIDSLAAAVSGPAVAQPALVGAPSNVVPGANVAGGSSQAPLPG